MEGKTPTTEDVRAQWGYFCRYCDDDPMTDAEKDASFDRWLADELHMAYGRGFDEGFKAGYAEGAGESDWRNGDSF